MEFSDATKSPAFLQLRLIETTFVTTTDCPQALIAFTLIVTVLLVAVLNLIFTFAFVELPSIAPPPAVIVHWYELAPETAAIENATFEFLQTVAGPVITP